MPASTRRRRNHRWSGGWSWLLLQRAQQRSRHGLVNGILVAGVEPASQHVTVEPPEFAGGEVAGTAGDPNRLVDDETGSVGGTQFQPGQLAEPDRAVIDQFVDVAGDRLELRNEPVEGDGGVRDLPASVRVLRAGKPGAPRSEERRVGEECRGRWAAEECMEVMM